MKITTAAEMREIDRVTSERYGVPSLTLMENAGTHVAAYVLRRYSRAQRICVVCGKGNNGGDGFVAARKLHEAGKKVTVLLLGDPADVKGDAAAMLKQLPVSPVIIRNENQLKSEVAPPLSRPNLARQGGEIPEFTLNESDLILDAILGTGFKPPVSGLIAAVIEQISRVPRSSPGLTCRGDSVPEGAPHLPGVGKCGSVSNATTRSSPGFDALGWRMAERVQQASILAGDMVDVAFTLELNDHPEYGGLELRLEDVVKSAPVSAASVVSS